MAKKTKKLNKEKERLTEEMFHNPPVFVEYVDEYKYPPSKPVDSVEFYEYPADFVPFAIQRNEFQPMEDPEECFPAGTEAELCEIDGKPSLHFINASLANLKNGLKIFVGHGEYAYIHRGLKLLGKQRIAPFYYGWNILKYIDGATILRGFRLERVTFTCECWHEFIHHSLFIYIKDDSDEWHFREGESVFYDQFLYPKLRTFTRKWLKEHGKPYNEESID